ncbi:MAG TPA: VOC family protein [Acidobacteriaceae bacterium]|nr:VOC family protein [Acidobacteriaceae bacterium]
MNGRNWQRAAATIAAPILASIATAVAQNPSPNLSGIAHVAIRVSNLDASRAFFHKLGFEEAFAMNKQGKPTEALFKINDRQFIELYPRNTPAEWAGFMHICFEAADIEALHQDYVAHGLTPKPIVRAGAGNLLFTLQGPDEPGAPSDPRLAATQNIEYTQYMPGSRHTLDGGRHLGPDRVAEQMAGVGIRMQDLEAAASFYEDKLSFRLATHPLERGVTALTLPGTPDEQIELLSPAAEPSGQPAELPAIPHSANAGMELHFRILFSIPDLRTTRARLRSLGFAPKKHGATLTIHDPDGDAIVFVAARTDSAAVRAAGH